MRNWVRRKAQARLLRFIRTRYALVKPEATLGLFNFRCFENAVEYSRRYPELEIVEAIYVDEGEPCLHYLNFDPAANKYLETTLGWRAPHLEYYVIRKLHQDDYKYVHHEFERALASWTEQFLPWPLRILFNLKRIL